jgi:hypothetical protein
MKHMHDKITCTQGVSGLSYITTTINDNKQITNIQVMNETQES